MIQFEIKQCQYTGVGLITEERGEAFTGQHATTPYGVVRILKWRNKTQPPQTTLITTHGGNEYRAHVDAICSDQYTKTLARRFAEQVYDQHCKWWRDRLDYAAAKEGAFVEKLRADHVKCIDELQSHLDQWKAEADNEAARANGYLSTLERGFKERDEARRDCRELLSILLNLRWDEGAHCFEQVDRLAAKYLKQERADD